MKRLFKSSVSIFISVATVLCLVGCESAEPFNTAGLWEFEEDLQNEIGIDDDSSNVKSANAKASREKASSQKKQSKNKAKANIAEDLTVTPSYNSYSIKTSFGDKLEADPGYTVLSVTNTKSVSCDHSPTVILPFLGDYLNGDISVESEYGPHEGVYNVSYTLSKKADMNAVERYLKDLSSYGCTVDRTIDGAEDFHGYYIKCSKVKKQGLIFYDFSSYYDLYFQVSAFDSNYRAKFEYSPEIWFDYSSLSDHKDSNTVTFKTETRYVKERLTFPINGYGESGDELTIGINFDNYAVGTVLDLNEQQKQLDKWSKSCFVVFLSEGSKSVGSEKLTDVEVKILEFTDSTAVISFKISYLIGTDLKTFEGIAYCNEFPEDYGRPTEVVQYDSDYTFGSIMCSGCGGTGTKLCSSCGGDGMLDCPNCGNGSYWQSGWGANGSVKICSRCGGNGHIKCTAFGCNNGKVQCLLCGGKGTLG